MQGHITNRLSILSLLRSWIVYLYWSRTRNSMHRANDISAAAALTGNPPGA
jgi:hypothetical protein